MKFYKFTSAPEQQSPLQPYENKKPTLDLSRPTVVYFPSTITTDGNNFSTQVSNVGILATHLASSGQQPTDIFTLSYTPNRWRDAVKEVRSTPQFIHALTSPSAVRQSRTRHVLAHKNGKYDHVSEDAKYFVHAVLLPALLDEQGHFPDCETLQNKLSHLTFCGHSYGTIFSKEIGTELKNELDKHYETSDVKHALKHIILVAASNVSRFNSTERHFTGVYFESREDVFRRYVQDKTSPTHEQPARLTQLAGKSWHDGMPVPVTSSR
jgi:hypothetical protein